MKLKIEYEGKDDRNTPINFAKAVIDFMVGSHEDEVLFTEQFKEMVEYLDVYSRYLSRYKAWEI
jgi:hypothetical protein